MLTVKRVFVASVKPIKEIAPRENDVVWREVLACVFLCVNVNAAQVSPAPHAPIATHCVNRHVASSSTLTSSGNLADGGRIDVQYSTALVMPASQPVCVCV